MGVSKLEATALTVLEERGVDVARLRAALALADLSPGSVQVVDDTLACALMGKRREEDLSLVSEPNPQAQIDRLTSDCLIAQMAVLHTMS